MIQQRAEVGTQKFLWRFQVWVTGITMADSNSKQPGMLEELLRVPNIGLNIVEKLVNAGIETGEDLAQRSVGEIKNIVGVGDETARQVASTTAKCLEQGLDLSLKGVRSLSDAAIDSGKRIADVTADTVRSATNLGSNVSKRSLSELHELASQLETVVGKILTSEQIMSVVAAGYDSIEKLRAATAEQLLKIQNITADTIEKLTSFVKEK